MNEITDLFTFVGQLVITYGLQIIGAGLVFLIGRWVARWLSKGVETTLHKTKIDPTIVHFTGNLAYYIAMVVVIVAALSLVGIPTTSVVAALGAATLAIGLALQGSLSNFAAGVVIIIFAPYKVGHWIEVGGVYGQVTQVQIFNTMLNTLDNRVVIIPNGHILNGNIINYSLNSYVRLDLIINISYRDDLLQAKQILLEILQADERVAKEPKPAVAVAELAENSVNLAVRPYVRPEHMTAVRFYVMEQTKLRFDQVGITSPFPQRVVYNYTPHE